MKQDIIALTGISGVGKSFLLNKIRTTHAFQGLSASKLIANAKSSIVADSDIGEQLRRAKIDDNQANLISSFHQARDKTAPCIILDGHALIDTPNGYVPIDYDVFAKIGISRIVNLVDNARDIFNRRNHDAYRTRPNRSESDINGYQEAAQTQCLRIAIALKIPLLSIPISQSDYFSSTLPKI